MKLYYLTLAEHIIGFVYLILFLIGFFNNIQLLYFVGGIGMFIFITIEIIDDKQKQWVFLWIIVIGSIISALFSDWYKGIFWITCFFTFGQIPGFMLLLTNRSKMIEQAYLKSVLIKLDNKIPVDDIKIRDRFLFLILIALPFLVTEYIIL